MSYGAMDFTPLLCVSKSPEQSLFLLISGLLLAVPVIFVVPMITTIPAIYCVDLVIFLLLLL
jgi:hypothetical protein